MIKKTMLIIIFTIHFCGMSFSQDGTKHTVSVSFKLDLSTELKKLRSLSSIGIRGNTAPLSWDKTYLMTDEDKNGIYETTIQFETTEPNQRIKYKYIHDTASWEKGSDRAIALKGTELILPVDKWNVVFKKNTIAYLDSVALHELYITITKLDSVLFHAYNNCEQDKYLEQYDALFSEDFEFYHDKGGLSTSKKETTESVKKYVCGKVRRELLKGSIEVSPIPGFGAIELGSHRFHNLVENSTSGYSKFVVVWQYKNNEWKVTRVISLHK